jgi:hypothetical protein
MYKYERESKKRHLRRALAGAGLLLVAGTVAVYYGNNTATTSPAAAAPADAPAVSLADFRESASAN